MIKSYPQILHDALVGKRIKVWFVTFCGRKSYALCSYDDSDIWREGEIIGLGNYYISKRWITLNVNISGKIEEVRFHFHSHITLCDEQGI